MSCDILGEAVYSHIKIFNPEFGDDQEDFIYVLADMSNVKISSVKCDENIKMISQIGTPRLHIGNLMLLIAIVLDSHKQYSKC